MASFSIEVPGEANPLTENTLLNVLASAASRDPQQVQTGTKQLQQWEKASGYYKHLQSVFVARQLPVEVRYLAVIQLKNGIDKYWRKTAANAVSPDDKATIRSRLIESGLDEHDPRLALQNALVIAKVARFEYPSDWPDVITTIIGSLRSSTHQEADQQRLFRILLILLHITKELSTGRLQRTRQSLQAVTPEIIAVLGAIYFNKVRSWQNNLNDADTTIPIMEQSLLAIKVVRRLLIAGYEFPNRNTDVLEFWNLTFAQVRSFMQISIQSPTVSSQETQLVEKHLLQLSKLHLEMAKTHPAAFVLLPNSLDLVRAYWDLIKEFGQSFGSREAVVSALVSARIGTNGDHAEDRAVLEKLSLKGLLLIRACLRMVFNPVQTFKYRHAQEKEEKSHAESKVRQELLTPSFVQEVMEVIITKFFVFRESDLREWEEEPEEWERREEGESEGFEFSIRPCSERVFLDLAINYRDMLVQPLLEVFHTVATPDSEDVLFKDSVYTAIGLSAAVVNQHLDFNAFITSTLVHEVQKQKPGFSILRRRIAILLGQWITIKVSDENRPVVYQIFQHLLDPGDPLNDQVVRITAGRQFKNIADDWEFKAETFVSYAETILTRLMQLIEELELTETKLALLNTISVLVERLEHHIAPYAERIVTLLPALWEQSGDEHLMKQAILTILARLVNSMKSASLPFHSMVLPIVKGAVEPGSETQVYLLEDALELWSAILIQTPSPASTELLSLAPYLFSIFELGSENLRKALEIAESYMLLAPSEMLTDAIRKPLLTSLASLIGTLRPDANGLVNNLVEVIIRAAESLGGEGAVGQVMSDMIESRFLTTQLEGLRGSWVAHCTTGPLAKDPLVDGIVETDYFSVLARLVLGSTSIFLQATQAAAPVLTGSNSGEDTMKWLLEEWFNHFENVGDPSRRKLMCMAMTKLLETSQPFILSNLQLLMTVWTDVVTELREDEADTQGDSLVYADSEALKVVDGPEAPEDERRRGLSLSDPVHSVRLPLYIKHYLQMAIERAGGNEAFQAAWLINVDQDVVAAFGKLGIM